MSKWITDRLPTEEDCKASKNTHYESRVWVMCDDGVRYDDYWGVPIGCPWHPIVVETPEPYVAPMDKHYAIFYMGNDREDWSWRVCDGRDYVASKLPTQDAAERVAAIYNEVMP